MATPPLFLKALVARRSMVLAGIAKVGDFRPGTLFQHYTRCGKVGCRCAKPGALGHGPVWSLTRKEGSRTISWRVPAEALPLVQAQIAEYRRFRAMEKELIEINEQIADARVEADTNAFAGMAKKGALQRRLGKPSPSKSSGKSTHS